MRYKSRVEKYRWQLVFVIKYRRGSVHTRLYSDTGGENLPFVLIGDLFVEI